MSREIERLRRIETAAKGFVAAWTAWWETDDLSGCWDDATVDAFEALSASLAADAAKEA